jgi:hypothetical protein
MRAAAGKSAVGASCVGRGRVGVGVGVGIGVGSPRPRQIAQITRFWALQVALLEITCIKLL